MNVIELILEYRAHNTELTPEHIERFILKHIPDTSKLDSYEVQPLRRFVEQVYPTVSRVWWVGDIHVTVVVEA